MRKILLLVLIITFISCSESTSKRYVKPTNGYAQMVVAETDGVKTVYISGQVGEGDHLETQMRDVLNKIGKLLDSEGGSYEDLVKINTYIVDYQPEHIGVFRDVRKEIFTDEITPASTLVGVSSLALPDWLIEIDAVAVIEN